MKLTPIAVHALGKPRVADNTVRFTCGLGARGLPELYGRFEQHEAIMIFMQVARRIDAEAVSRSIDSGSPLGRLEIDGREVSLEARRVADGDKVAAAVATKTGMRPEVLVNVHFGIKDDDAKDVGSTNVVVDFAPRKRTAEVHP